MKRILVIENRRDIREILQWALELEGYKVSSAPNAKEGLAIAKMEEAPALILLDLVMPVMSGDEFLEIRRNDRHLSSIPVIVVSGTGDPEALKDFEIAGFVRKPFNLDELINAVRAQV